MKRTAFPAGRVRTSPRSRRPAHSRLGPALLSFALLAGLTVSPDAERMARASVGGGPPQFESQASDQFGGVQRPSRIAVSDAGEIYVSDALRGVVAIFDAQGRRVGTLTGFDQPLGLAVSVLNRCGAFGCVCRPVETAYVADERDGSVAVFEEGRRVRMLGAGPGEFIMPNGIAVTRDQVAYVVDSRAHHVKIFAPDGELHGTFGSYGWGAGQLDFPTDIAFNQATSEVYVADYGNERIAVFTHDGAWVRELWAPNNDRGDPAFYRIAGLGIGPAGNLYVVDSALATVTIMTPDGALVDIIGYEQGAYWTGELKVPIDAATDGSSLYVTSSKDRLVKVFGAIQ